MDTLIGFNMEPLRLLLRELLSLNFQNYANIISDNQSIEPTISNNQIVEHMPICLDIQSLFLFEFINLNSG